MPLRRFDYDAHQSFLTPVRETAQLWRFVVGLIGASVIAFALMYLINQTIHAVTTDAGYAAFFYATEDGSTPFGMLFVLCSFVTMAAGVFVIVRLLHKRSIASLFGPFLSVRRDFMRVTLLLIGLMIAVLVLPPWDMGEPLTQNLRWGLWITLLPLSLIGVLIQTSAEEILFRGYIQQQLAARFNSPIIWMVLPSALFALGHYVPAEAGENAWMVALWAGIFGILMADLTARAGNLGPAMAVHFVNNVIALLIVSLPDSLYGLALFLAPYSMQDTDMVRQWMPVDFAFMLCSWLVARLAIRR
jgi:membrane protease YdiL (CAAX protease family)